MLKRDEGISHRPDLPALSSSHKSESDDTSPGKRQPSNVSAAPCHLMSLLTNADDGNWFRGTMHSVLRCLRESVSVSAVM